MSVLVFIRAIDIVMDRDIIRFSFRFRVRDCVLVSFRVCVSLVLG